MSIMKEFFRPIDKLFTSASKNSDEQERHVKSSQTSIINQVTNETGLNISRQDLQDAFSIVYDAINSTVGGIIITDVEGKIIYLNPAFLSMFGYDSEKEVLGRNAVRLFPSSEIRKFSDVKNIIDMAKGESEEFSATKKDGGMFTVEVRSSNVTNHENQIVGRMASFADITERKQIEQDRERLIQKLQSALDKIKTLKGIIPICASCKNVRDDKGFWHQVEAYIRDHSEVDFSHGICPECVKILYPDFKQSGSKNVSGQHK